VRLLTSVLGGLLAGVLAGVGLFAGILVGMSLGGKAAIVAWAYVLVVAGTGSGAWLARLTFTSLRTLPVHWVCATEAAAVGALGFLLVLSGQRIFETDVVNPLFLGGPVLVTGAVAMAWAFASQTRDVNPADDRRLTTGS
jgi:LytS/YehU family sensor histidine kinase